VILFSKAAQQDGALQHKDSSYNAIIREKSSNFKIFELESRDGGESPKIIVIVLN